MATYSLYSGSGPALTSYGGPFQSGIAFQVTEGGCWFLGYRWWVPSGGDTTAQKFALWCITVNSATGNALVSGSVITSGALTANAWNVITLPTPLQLAPGAAYIACTGWTAVNGFPDTNNVFGSGDPDSAGITNGPLFAYSDVANGGSGTAIPVGIGAQGQFSANSGATDPSIYMPIGSSNSANFGMDVIISDTAPSGYSGSYRMWPNFAGVSQQNNNMVDLNDAYILGTEFTLSASCTLNNIWFYSPPTAAQLPTQCAIWNVGTQTMVSGTLNTSPSWSGAAASGWVSCAYSGVTLPAGDYKVSVWNASASGTGTGWNAYTPSYWTTGAGASNLVSGPITMPNETNATSPGQSTYQTSSSTFLYPNTYASGTPGQNYWVDIEVTPPSAGSALYQPQQHGSRLYHKRHTRFQRMPSIPGLNTELGPLSLVLMTLQTSLSGHVVEFGGLIIPLPTLVTSLSGTAQHTESGSLAIPLPTLTVSLNGHVVESGGLAIPLPTLHASLSGTAQHTESGALAIPLPTLTVTLAGSVIGGESGAFAPVLPKPVANLSGTITHQGAFAVPLLTLLTSLSGTAQHTESGALAVPLPTLTATLTGKVGHAGALAVPLTTLRASLSGTAQHTESGALAIPLPTAAATLAGLIAHKGSFAITLPAIQTAIAGSPGGNVTGSFVIILPPGQRFQLEAGSFNPVLPTLATSITGRRTGEAGSFNLALPLLYTVLAGIAQQSISGNLNLVLPISAVGGLVARVGHENGQLTIALATIQVSLTGVLVHVGVLNPNLGIGMQLTRYEMFGSESRAEIAMLMTEPTLDLAARIEKEKTPSLAGFFRAKQVRTQRRHQLREARRRAGHERPRRAGEEELWQMRLTLGRCQLMC